MRSVAENDLVSIVIPVFNTEEYLDACLHSIVNQSYSNIEIILVNDGSTDSSYEVCKIWREKDPRIRLLTQKKQGQGIARNLGVKNASGQWIAFVDSDDWVDSHYIESLMNAIKREHANMARCNYTQIRVISGDRKTTNFYEAIGIRRTEHDIMVVSSSVICNCIVKRNIIIDYEIKQPSCKGQDCAVGLLMCLLAKKIAYVNDSLYYYRKERKGATTEGALSKRHELVTTAIPWLIQGLKKHELYISHRELIKGHIAQLLTQTLWGEWLTANIQQYVQLKELYYKTYQQLFYEKNCVIATLGSWNLTETAKRMPYIQDMEYSFHFSSIISLMNKFTGSVDFVHKNTYRRKMIEKDIYSKMWDLFDIKAPDYLLIDFLEERNDIIKWEHGCISKSVAIMQADISYEGSTILEFGSSAWIEEWKQSFDHFANRIMEYMPRNRVFLVKNLLTERHGDISESWDYDNIEEIRSKNQVLEKCYQYAIGVLSGCQVIDMTRDSKYMTDEKYEYGVQPYYLNTLINEEVGRMIVDNMQ